MKNPPSPTWNPEVAIDVVDLPGLSLNASFDQSWKSLSCLIAALPNENSTENAFMSQTVSTHI